MTLSSQPTSKPTAIVIGSGFGGLAGSIRLAHAGYAVTLLEKQDQLGGRARVFKQDGYTFDAGPTIITAPFMLEELWSMCGRNFSDDVELRLMDPFYRIRFDDGDHFDYANGVEQVCAEIERFAPSDLAGYKRYLQASKSIFKVGFEELADEPFGSFMDMLKIVPDMARLQSYRTVYSLVSKYVKDPRLRIVLSFHPLLVGGNPFAVTSIYSLISYLEQNWGVHSAIGGTGKIVAGMAKLIADQGTNIRLNSEVEQINVDNGRATGVRLTSGETLAADIVVSNADSAWTYRHLIPKGVARRWTERKLEKSHYSNGLFVWYFGTNTQYPDIPHHTILMGSRYRGLLDDIFQHKTLSTDCSLYLHRPSATDPSMAPDGCDCFYVLSPVPHLDAEVDWRTQAEPYRQQVQERLASTVMPGLDAALDTSLVTTPLDFQNDLNSYKGAGFSFEPRLTQSAWFRPHNKSEDIEGLFFVGAGTHPGAGVPGVLSSARILSKVVPDASAF